MNGARSGLIATSQLLSRTPVQLEYLIFHDINDLAYINSNMITKSSISGHGKCDLKLVMFSFLSSHHVRSEVYWHRYVYWHVDLLDVPRPLPHFPSLQITHTNRTRMQHM